MADYPILSHKSDENLNSTNVDQVLSLFGEPSQFVVGDFHHNSYTLTLFYPETGVAFITGGNSGFNITPNTDVSYAFFMKPTDLKGMLQILYGNKEVEIVLSSVQDWKGYGPVTFPP